MRRRLTVTIRIRPGFENTRAAALRDLVLGAVIVGAEVEALAWAVDDAVIGGGVAVAGTVGVDEDLGNGSFFENRGGLGGGGGEGEGAEAKEKEGRGGEIHGGGFGGGWWVDGKVCFWRRL